VIISVLETINELDCTYST